MSDWQSTLNPAGEPCPNCQTLGRVVGHARGVAVLACPACDLQFLPAAIRPLSDRDNHWYSDMPDDAATAELFLSEMGEPYRKQLGILRGFLPGVPQPRLLDVGAGIGVFLKIAEQQGFAAHAADTSEHAISYAKRHYGIQYATDLEQFPDHSFDVVRIAHVLEHVGDPHPFLHLLRRKLKPNGVLAVIVPTGEPLCVMLMHRLRRLRSAVPRLSGAIYPHMHVLGFSPASLGDVVRQSGFSTLEQSSVSMGSSTYFPLLYDGLLRRNTLKQRGLKNLLKMDLPCILDTFGNPFGRGQWLVGYYRAAALPTQTRAPSLSPAA
jgi:SAM-dependent methyltransferase